MTALDRALRAYRGITGGRESDSVLERLDGLTRRFVVRAEQADHLASLNRVHAADLLHDVQRQRQTVRDISHELRDPPKRGRKILQFPRHA